MLLGSVAQWTSSLWPYGRDLGSVSGYTVTVRVSTCHPSDNTEAWMMMNSTRWLIFNSRFLVLQNVQLRFDGIAQPVFVSIKECRLIAAPLQTSHTKLV